MSISKRLFIAMLGLTTVVVLVTLGMARWSFERGFLDYTNALEEDRLRRLSKELEGVYRRDMQWNSDITERMEHLLRASMREHLRPPRRHRGHLPGGPGGRPRGRGGPPEIMPGHGMPPTALFDHQGVFLAGNSELAKEPDLVRVKIEVNGRRVGELRSLPRRVFESAQETEFSSKQMQASVLIGVLALLAATLLSWMMASALVSPVRRLLSGVRMLSAGDYSVRVEGERTDELGQLVRDVNHLARSLEESQSSRRRWLASISHELRTPLTVLVGEIHALKDGVRSFDAEQLDSLDAEVQRLYHLIEDLYTLSVTDIGGLRYTLVLLDLGDLLQQRIERYAERLPDNTATITWEVDSELWIRGDAQRLEQLVGNLLSNALAYSNAPAQIHVTAAANLPQVVVTIEDSPPCVEAGHYGKLFEPLHREEASRARRTGGAGLGLAICRNIVDSHGGQIQASPSSLGGLKVTMSFPREESPDGKDYHR